MAGLQETPGPDPIEFITTLKLQEIKSLVVSHSRLDFSFLNEMR